MRILVPVSSTQRTCRGSKPVEHMERGLPGDHLILFLEDEELGKAPVEREILQNPPSLLAMEETLGTL